MFPKPLPLPLVLIWGLFLLAPCQSYELNNTFSEIIKSLDFALHFEQLMVNHPLYKEIGEGSLPLGKFKAFIQQDDLYVKNLLGAFSILADRESNPIRKEYLRNISNESWDPIFKTHYDNFTFSKAEKFIPGVLEYSAFQLQAAREWDLGSALATFVPCYDLWGKMGVHILKLADLPNNPYHPYKEFILSISDDSYVKPYLDFVDGYYDRLNSTRAKQDMINTYFKALEHEINFAESTYREESPETIPPPMFSNLAMKIRPDLQNIVLRHPLYEELGNGTLPMDKFQTLIQQYYVFLRGFYKAFEIIEKKESNLESKRLLRKNEERHYSKFDEMLKSYNFPYAPTTLKHTQGYVDYLLEVAEYGTVGEALAGLYPSYYLWNEVGIQMNQLADFSKNPHHPYRTFLEPLAQVHGHPLKQMTDLVNSYYERIPGEDVVQQLRMFRAVEMSIYQNGLFISGVYENN